MKKFTILPIVFVTMFIVVSCGPKREEQVKEFAVRFADFVNTNQKDSIQEYYPEFELTDSLANVPVSHIMITPKDNEGEYYVEYSSTIGMSVNLNKYGEITISESKGLFDFLINKIELAKKTGMWDDSLSDLELAERMNDEEFFNFINKKNQYNKNNILTVGKNFNYIYTEKEAPIEHGYYTITNNTDQTIYPSDYKMNFIDDADIWDIEKYSEDGVQINPSSSIKINSTNAHFGSEGYKEDHHLVGVTILLTPEQIQERFMKFTGNEYQEYIQGKGVSSKRKKSSSNESQPTLSRRVGNDAFSYIAASPSVDKNGELVHFFRGYFTDGKKQYPIMIAFIEKNGKISSAQYKNINYAALVKMNVKFSSRSMTLEGKSGKKDFSIYLTSDNEGKSWTGTAESNSTLEVFLEPTSEEFKF